MKLYGDLIVMTSFDRIHRIASLGSTGEQCRNTRGQDLQE
jgi:hypothetical protein